MKRVFLKLLVVLISVVSIVASMFVVNAVPLSGDERAYFVTYDDVQWLVTTYSNARFQRLERTITDEVGKRCKEAILARGLDDPYDDDEEDD